MNNILSDFRFALRMLAKTPGFTAVAVLSLALALGANSAVFSLVNAAMLAPVRPDKPGAIVSIFTVRQGVQRDYRRFSFAEFQALRAEHAVFADVAAIAKAAAGISTTRTEGLSRSPVYLTTDNFFPLLGAVPARGRFFNAEESRPNANIPVVVASHAVWQRLGADPDFVGSTVWVNGHQCTVIGITREDFNGGSVVASPELWLPLGMYSQVGGALGPTDLLQPDAQRLLLVARLGPGLTSTSVAPRLPPLAKQLGNLDPTGTADPRELQITPLSRMGFTTAPIDHTEIAFLAVPLVFMAACVLLIASLNLANMLLARGAMRAREIAVRIALGASRARIVQQLLVEGLVLSLAGGSIGLLFSVWANNAMVFALANTLRNLASATLTFQPKLDVTVVGLTLLTCVATTLVSGLVPALRASKLDVVSDLKAVGARTVTGGKWNRFFAGRHLLVMAQIALSLVLLFSASLFLRGALKAGDIPLGFEARDSLVTEMDFSLRNATPAEAQGSLTAVLDRVNALPGVARAAVSTQTPMSNTETERRVLRADAPLPATDAIVNTPPGTAALYSGITPGYFDTLSVPVLRGRDFTELESRDARAPRVAIIDTSLAKKLFPAGDALGQRIRFSLENAEEMEIVGITGEHRHEFLQVEPTFRVFVPLVHAYTGRIFLQTRLADGSRAGIEASLVSIRSELQRLNPDLPILRHEPLADFIGRDVTLWSAKLGAVVFTLFGAIALLLSVMGVYSVKAYAVAARTREIGIRCALGARPRDILGLVMMQGARQIAVACVAGIVLSLLVGKGLTSLLFHISPADPFSLAAAMIVLVIPALVASYIPARRAIRVDPIVALRSE